jgi:alkyl sulfatase BDS1-like metallo-beta-lactamase superfamily hydrolase
MKASLTFADQRDFQEAKRGFIAAPAFKQIKADAGHVAWNMGSYEWLLSGKDFASIHPSRCNARPYSTWPTASMEVVPGRIYLVRGMRPM